MNAADIQVGDIYHDGKLALREVLAIAPNVADMVRVEYRILAAKVEQEYSYTEKRMVPVIGSTSSCYLASFASWAKVRLEPAAGKVLLLELQARKVKLSPGEVCFIESALAEAGGEITPGTVISFDHTEGRAVGGLEKKGLVVRQKGEVEITELGAAWFRNAAQARIAG